MQHRRGSHDAHAGSDDLAAVLHRGQPMVSAVRDLHALVQALVAEAAAAGEVRSDVPTSELTSFCLHALDTAEGLPSEASVSRLVALVMDGLRPQT